MGLRVLVIEDEFLIRWSITETLVHAGCDVLEAGDGTSALQVLSGPGAPIDAVVMDYRLPDSNDLSLLAQVRRLSPNSAVILMTAFGTPEMKKCACDLGVFRVLDKPFELRDLQTTLFQACRSRPH